MSENTNASQPDNKPSEFTLQSIENRTYGPADLEQAQVYIQMAVETAMLEDVNPIFNFDTEKELPEGYGLSIIPITERVAGQGNVTKGLVIAAVPSVNLLLKADGGENWIRKQITSLLNRSIANAVKTNEDGSAVLPFEVSDFISSTRSPAMAAFNAVASLFVSALKVKGLKIMNKELLRQILSNAEFAQQHFPKIQQSNWEIVIKSMIAQAGKDGLDPGNLAHWLKTRDQVSLDAADIDLNDLSEMVEKKAEEVAAKEKVTV